MAANIIDQLKNVYEKLTPKMKKLASFLIDNHKEAAFLNATALAREAGVSEATVTRLAYVLNMKGYQDFKEALKNHAKDFMSLPRYESSRNEDNILSKVANMEKSIIDEMLTTIASSKIEAAVDTLYHARRIVIVGMHYNIMPAAYSAYFLRAFRDNISMINKLDVAAFQRLKGANTQDAALLISTARYPKACHKALEMLKKRGAKTILITDSPVAPSAPLADIVLVVPMKFISYIDPYAAVMTLLHALITGIFLKNTPKAKKHLKEFDEFMDENNYNTIHHLDVTELL
ncbi:MAG: MurR/RpiR family transcriptional regulator [Candidatus Adiutrix sp.]